MADNSPAPHFIDGLYGKLIEGGIGYFFPSARLESLEPHRHPAQDLIERESGSKSVVLHWLGSRYSLTRDELFSDSEINLLRAIGDVLDSRYRMIVDTTRVEQRFELFRGLAEDRYVSSYIDSAPYAEPVWKGPDRVSTVSAMAFRLWPWLTRPGSLSKLSMSTSGLSPFRVSVFRYPVPRDIKRTAGQHCAVVMFA
jgi:hypothetical protein